MVVYNINFFLPNESSKSPEVFVCPSLVSELLSKSAKSVVVNHSRIVERFSVSSANCNYCVCVC